MDLNVICASNNHQFATINIKNDDDDDDNQDANNDFGETNDLCY